MRALDDQADGHPVLDSSPRADRSAQRHDRDRARLLELLRRDRIVDAIDHRLEALVHQHFRRAQRLAHVGVEGLRLAQHLELHQRPTACLAREAERADRLVRGEAADGVGKIGDLLRVDEVGQHRLARVGDVHLAHRDGDDLRARSFHRRRILLEALVLARADDQPRAEGPARDRPRIRPRSGPGRSLSLLRRSARSS